MKILSYQLRTKPVYKTLGDGVEYKSLQRVNFFKIALFWRRFSFIGEWIKSKKNILKFESAFKVHDSWYNVSSPQLVKIKQRFYLRYQEPITLGDNLSIRDWSHRSI